MDERSIEDFNRKLEECNTKSVTQTIENIGGVISDDNTAYVTQKMSFIDTDMTPRETTLYSMRTCTCGRLLSKNNPVEGRCQHRNCANFTCGECVNACRRCKRNFCSSQVIRWGSEEVYCFRCLPIKMLRSFFNPSYGRSEK